ncbi:zinc finger imprinted 3-like [Anopheles bellator]|uniref:zinc finger imprinted 3-like n=1 Tax=Anopheles bellator TaxID=139047 RepID=UPI002647D575|nr:zinc finger imprinted 3-like [Anopheles bellator]
MKEQDLYDQCVVCLNRAKPCENRAALVSCNAMFSIDGVNVSCAAMYANLIELTEINLTDLEEERLKICLACLPELHNCYMFKKRVIQSFESLIRAIQEQKAHTELIVELVDGVVDLASEEQCKKSQGDVTDDTNEEHLMAEYIDDYDNAENEENIRIIEVLSEPESVETGYVPSQDAETPENAACLTTGQQSSDKCPHCAEILPSSTTIMQHFMNNHCVTDPSQGPTCEICTRNFQNLKTLRQHLRVHLDQKRFVCRHCCKSFFYRHHMLTHEVTHSDDRSFSCDQCPKSFATKNRLNWHKKMHEPYAAFQCDECPKRFRVNHRLTLHKCVKHNAATANFEPVKCEKCGKELFSRPAVSYHARSKCHDDGLSKQYRCIVCRISFPALATLLQHLKDEHNEQTVPGSWKHQEHSRPFQCDICSQRFSQKIVLRRHKLIHKGIKPFECEHCHRRFTQNGTLKTHLRTHTDDRPFRCKICGQHFRSAGSLMAHKRKHCNKNSTERVESP